MICASLFGVVAFLATAAVAADEKKAALIETMQQSGCEMTTAQAGIQMPDLGIDRATAIKFSREMMAEGIVAFADDEETLLLLPLACK